jgi:hypothetical protein
MVPEIIMLLGYSVLRRRPSLANFFSRREERVAILICCRLAHSSPDSGELIIRNRGQGLLATPKVRG